MVKINRNSKKTTDIWLTPKLIIDILGPFDLDPACPYKMPWKTANYMVRQSNPDECGLILDWSGRVWCNPPFSNILPFAKKMIAHGNGIMLTPAKSTDSEWGQAILSTADVIFFKKRRISFCLEDGTPSTGAWAPYMFAAWGESCCKSLEKITGIFDGVFMKRHIAL